MIFDCLIIKHTSFEMEEFPIREPMLFGVGFLVKEKNAMREKYIETNIWRSMDRGGQESVARRL